MKNRILCITALLALVLSACGSSSASQTTPTVNGEDVQNTAIAAAFTVVAETQASIPTNTLVPPTPTFTETPAPTNTPEPSPTLDVTLTAVPTDLPTLAPTFTPQPAAAASGDCNKPITEWSGPTASFSIMNETKPQGKVILLMSVVTKTGECGYLNIYSTSFTGPVGTYSAAAFVDGKKSFKVFGSFFIQEGGWKIIVRNDVIVAKGACYPHC